MFHIIIIKSRYNEEKFNQAINELGKLKDEIIALKQYSLLKQRIKRSGRVKTLTEPSKKNAPS